MSPRTRASFEPDSDGTQSRGLQLAADRVEEGPVPVQELDLDLAPCGLLDGPVGQPRPVNRVVRDGRERVAVGVQQSSFDAGGVQYRDGDQRAVADERTDLAGQGAWHRAGRAAQWEADLGALVLPGRQLEVPAGVIASGPTAQCDALPGQARVGSVEVRGVQLRLHPLAHGDRGPGQIRQERAGVNIELTLNLTVTSHEL